MEKISAIIPVLNEQGILPKILTSLKSQEGVEVEIIVADANSKDNSVKIAESFGAKIIKGGLPSVGRNNGAKVSKNERLVFLDADVEFDNCFLSNCINYMDRKNISVAASKSRPLTKRLIEKFLFGAWDFYTSLTQFFYPHAAGYCIFSTKTVHEKINGFDERIRLGEDTNYVLRASKVAKFRVIPFKIGVSTRRAKKEGAVRFAYKLIACEMRRVFRGKEDTDNHFKYDYSHEEKS
ncbi:MAG: glycosyltransferase [Candidatus Paceibacterota bacterium]|jgi:glycosyltransferase involved in cell wall biosynthesis